MPYYLMLLGGTQQRVRRRDPEPSGPPGAGRRDAGSRCITRKIGRRAKLSGQYVLRHKVETFRKLTADLVKPAESVPEMYQDWGDDVAYSLQLGRGECAA